MFHINRAIKMNPTLVIIASILKKSWRKRYYNGKDI